jgi:hypothetical protein
VKKRIFSILGVLLRQIPISVMSWVLCRKIQCFEKKTSSVKIFVLDRDRFREDIVALNQYTDIEYYDFTIGIQDNIAALFAYQYDYVKGAENTEYHIAHAQYLRKLIPVLCQKMSVTGFISCGMYYSRHQDWEQSCKDTHIPFLCLHREGVGITGEPLDRLFGESMEGRRRFNGQHIMVGTDAFRNMLIKRGYAKPDDVSMTGVPRFDISAAATKSKPEKPQVLLFSFFLASGQVELVSKEGVFPEKKGFYKLFLDVHEQFARLAKENPDVAFVIKPKWYVSQWKTLIDMSVEKGCELTGSDAWPSNLTVVDDVPAQTLISASGLVIAFNSTTIFEAIQYDKHVLMPLYEEASSTHSDYLYLPDTKDSIHLARSSNEFITIVEQYISGKLDKKVADESLINEAVGYIDGSVSGRIQAIIIEQIDQITRGE